MRNFLFLALLCIGMGDAMTWNRENPNFSLNPIVNFISDGSTTVMVQSSRAGGNVQLHYSTENSNEWKFASIVSSSNISALRHLASCFINGQFVVFLDCSVSLVSQDGSHFTEVSVKVPWLYQISVVNTRAGSLLLAAMPVAFDGLLWLSTDGVTWNSAKLPIILIDKFASTSSFLILWGQNGTNYFSEDGTTWWSVSKPNLSPVYSPYYDVQKNELLTVTYDRSAYPNSTLYLSKDNGKTWSFISYIPSTVDDFAFACGYYAVTSYWYNNYSKSIGYGFFISKDLVHWTQISGPAPQLPVWLLPLDDLLYVILSYGYGYATTSDYQNWNFPDPGIALYWQNIFVLQDGSFIFEGDNISKSISTEYYGSVDGTTFVRKQPPPFNGYPYYTYSNQWTLDGIFYFFSGNKIFSTASFQTWDITDANVPSECTGNYQKNWFDQLVHGWNDTWVGICINVYSPDQQPAFIYTSRSSTGGWKQVFSSRNYQTHHSITFCNGVFVYLLNGVVYTSVDGSNWKIPNDKFSPRLPSQLSTVGDWILITQQGTHSIYSISEDGNKWQNLSLPIINPTLKYIENAATYLAYGSNGEVAMSYDGISWSLSEGLFIPTNGVVMSIEYSGKLWAAADDGGGIFIAQK